MAVLHFKLNNAGVALHTSSSPDTLDDLLPARPQAGFVETDERSALGSHLHFQSSSMLGMEAPPMRIAIVHLACVGTLFVGTYMSVLAA